MGSKVVTQGVVPRENTPLKDEPTQYEKPVHSFLLQSAPDMTHHPVKVMPAVRDFIEGLPELQATFKIADIVDQNEFTYSSVKKEMLELCGAWRGSDFYVNGGNRKDSWVNPNHKYKSRYADSVHRCKCGTLMTRWRTDPHSSDLNHDRIDDHADDCLREWRYRTWADVIESRREIITRSMKFGISPSDILARLGLERKYSKLYPVIQDMKMPGLKELRDQYIERRRNTTVELMPIVGTDVVAEMYGVSRTTVREDVAARGMSSSDFTDIRNRNKILSTSATAAAKY